VAASTLSGAFKPLSLQAFKPSSPASLQASIDQALADPVLARAFVGVRIEILADAGRGVEPSVLYTRDSQKLGIPASNMKLVTLAVAADRLGWNFAYDTRLDAIGPVANGTLDGDLVAVGGGDPSIAGQDWGPAPLFGEWADALTRAGIRRVNGRLLSDDRLFDREGLAAGWSWDYIGASYASPSSALSYNENAVVVRITPGSAVGAPAGIEVAPAGHGLSVRNDVTTGAAGSAPRVDVSRAPGTSLLVVEGSLPLGAAPIVRGASVQDPARFFVEGLRLTLAERGITIRDGVASMDDNGTDTRVRRTIATRTSAPLSTLAGYFLKVSQNFYADMLLKTIARGSGRPGTVSEGTAIVRETIGAWGVAPDEIVMNDGSGLSRYDYLTADAIVAVLRHVWHDDRLRGPFVAALPVAGRDGTLENRMKGTVLDDRVEAKTGTLANVRSLSGYLETTTGKHVVFAIVVNNFTSAAAPIDAVIERILALVAAA
jgi:D-alanyl-D-alanine carboxypeptidase/D-alanyl-D-alanine-endopeptidase (penicillin-binding protein 4)